MPKMKTHRASAKRFRVTGSGKTKKLVRRQATQGHFNAREDGSTMRLKRPDVVLDNGQTKQVKRLMPYSLKKKAN
jgi:large subunit ribosomal protein L35